MAQSKSQIQFNKVWNSKRRYKIGSVVSVSGANYQNTTGTNSSPLLGLDWIKTSKDFVLPIGQMNVYKVAPNSNVNIKEIGDFCVGIVENEFISANYFGGDENLLASYGL